MIKNIDLWENSQIPYLGKVLQGSLPKLRRILRILRFHAHDLNLGPKISIYKNTEIQLKTYLDKYY